jgi:hypothetical protein
LLLLTSGDFSFTCYLRIEKLKYKKLLFYLSLSLKEENLLEILAKKTVKITYRRKEKEEMGDCREWQTEELHALYSLPNFICDQINTIPWMVHVIFIV